MVPNTYIFDWEVFAHDWLFVFKEVATGAVYPCRHGRRL